ncbi:hypothetical protein DRP53_06340 [candidate division WOR-3 bacterium]|uniref:histidine kinase n=1 Tax=candidate division WOR-3 bacterium TaxID=2052148 RepID=A0A660SH39_UNCW3|nr:MAG: hypothetical protein DRP53_06340 [candidate division WOR-3 bacterium]
MRYLPKFGTKALPIYLLAGIFIIGLVTFIYSNRFVQNLAEETEKTSRLYAQYIRNPTLAPEEMSDFIFREVILKIKFPVVLTDTAGNPISWRNIGPVTDTSRIRKITTNLDRENEPVAIKIVTDGDSLIVGYIHYGIPPYARILKSIPFLLTGALSLFLLIGFWGFLQHRKSMEERIWISMAKETAHQLATPISSIMGWLEVLKGKIEDRYLRVMEEDVLRMKEVLEKFSRIGREPDLITGDPSRIVHQVVDYMKRRAHQGIEFIEEYKSQAKIRTDPILMRWAVENLIKNSLDAIGSRSGQIIITVEEDSSNVKISVTDTGGGVKTKRRIFEPGFSTKKYGWGLGLVLTKRIVEDYHRGRLQLVENTPTMTRFTITIPKEKQ